jgi:hypothetical protein
LVVNWFQDAVESGRKLVAAIPASIHTEIHRGAKLTERAFQALAQPPQDLLAKLPPMPQGYQRMLAGSTMVIVKTDEQLVVDTMPVRR